MYVAALTRPRLRALEFPGKKSVKVSVREHTPAVVGPVPPEL
jgi:hypothetical protein